MSIYQLLNVSKQPETKNLLVSLTPAGRSYLNQNLIEKVRGKGHKTPAREYDLVDKLWEDTPFAHVDGNTLSMHGSMLWYDASWLKEPFRQLNAALRVGDRKKAIAISSELPDRVKTLSFWYQEDYVYRTLPEALFGQREDFIVLKYVEGQDEQVPAKP